MRTLSKLLVLAASVAVSTSLAYADDIGPGSISIGQYNAEYYSASNTVSFMSGGDSGYTATAGDGYGSLMGYDGGTVTFGNLTGTGSGTFTFNLNTTGALSQSPLLTIATATSTLTYDLTGVTMVSNSGGDINIDTMGQFWETTSGGTYMAGPTNGSLDLTTQGSNMELTTYSGTAAIAPEPSSLLLFGTGLLGAAGFARRKFAGRFV
jgi:hypothetical protein